MGLIFNYVFIGLIVISFIFKFIYFYCYYNLVHAAYNISNSNNELIKQIKLRFTNCYKLNIPIRNTDAYVRKCLDSYSPHGIRYSFYNKISYVLISIFYILLWTAYTKNIFTIDFLTFLGIISFSLYSIFERVFSVNNLKYTFIALSSDFLDNTLKNRIEDKKSNVTLENHNVTSKKQNVTLTNHNVTPKSHITNKDVLINESSNEEVAATSSFSLNPEDTEIFASIIDEFL